MTKKTNLDHKGPKAPIPRPAIVIPQLWRDKQRSEGPVLVVVVLVVLVMMIVEVMLVEAVVSGS